LAPMNRGPIPGALPGRGSAASQTSSTLGARPHNGFGTSNHGGATWSPKSSCLSPSHLEGPHHRAWASQFRRWLQPTAHPTQKQETIYGDNPTQPPASNYSIIAASYPGRQSRHRGGDFFTTHQRLGPRPDNLSSPNLRRRHRAD